MTEQGPVERFLRASAAVQAQTVRISPGEVAECLLRLLQDDRSVVAAAGLDGVVEELRSRGVQIVSDDGSDAAAKALPQADAGLCRALAGVAASGTVLIGPGLGLEGLISTLPPHCVVLLSSNDIYLDLAGGPGPGGTADRHPGLSSRVRHRPVPHLRHRTHHRGRSARTSAHGRGGHR